MTEILSALLVLGVMMSVYAVLLGGGRGRVGRPPSGVLTRLKDPTGSPVAVAALSGFALGSMVTITDPAANGQSGLLIGIVLVVLLATPGIRHLSLAACGLVGVIMALWAMARFVLGKDLRHALEEVPSDQAIIYRVSLMLLIFAFYCLAVVVFDRGSTLRGERGLAMFALVEVVTFLAKQGNRDSLALDGVSHSLFLVIACVVAFILGWATSEYVLGVAALAVATVSLVSNAWLGDGTAEWVGLVAAATVAGLAVGLERMGVRVGRA